MQKHAQGGAGLQDVSQVQTSRMSVRYGMEAASVQWTLVRLV
jgi:hypothetical protein